MALRSIRIAEVRVQLPVSPNVKFGLGRIVENI